MSEASPGWSCDAGAPWSVSGKFGGRGHQHHFPLHGEVDRRRERGARIAAAEAHVDRVRAALDRPVDPAHDVLVAEQRDLHHRDAAVPAGAGHAAGVAGGRAGQAAHVRAVAVLVHQRGLTRFLSRPRTQPWRPAAGGRRRGPCRARRRSRPSPWWRPRRRGSPTARATTGRPCPGRACLLLGQAGVVRHPAQVAPPLGGDALHRRVAAQAGDRRGGTVDGGYAERRHAAARTFDAGSREHGGEQR